MEIVEVQNALSRMEELSPKLADIISAVEEGYYTQNEIAEYLRKSPATVRTQLGSIYKTTGIKSVTQLAIVVYYRTLLNSGTLGPLRKRRFRNCSLPANSRSRMPLQREKATSKSRRRWTSPK